jgi:4-azaleucine resistance transporter AzlC
MKSFWAGVRAEAPLLIGVFPFGLLYGTIALGAGLSPAPAQMMSAIVFAGSAQFVAAQLIRDAAPGLVIVLTIAVVNLRHMLYSATIAPRLQHLPARWKTVLAYLLTDEAFAVGIVQYDKEGVGPDSHWFLLGAGLALWTTWQISSGLGIFLGAALPASWPIDFALPITFIAMLMPILRGRPALAAALAAGAVALLAYGLPYKFGLILAAAAGVAAGLMFERRP